MADRLVRSLCWLAALLVCGTFIWLLSDVVRAGLPQLSLRFLIEDPTDAGRAGGILSVLVSTAMILAVCIATALPIGVAVAVYISEFTPKGSRRRRWLQRSLDVLAAVPSIVFGLFGNAFFCVTLGFGFSILSGGLTLACMVLPLLISAIEQGLRSVPDSYREGATALGVSKTTTLLRILLPAAAPALVAGLALSIGRALAETAALLFTSGYVSRMPTSVFDSGRSISVHIHDLAMNIAGGAPNAYASALVLVLGLLVVNSVVVWLSGRLLSVRTTG